MKARKVSQGARDARDRWWADYSRDFRKAFSDDLTAERAERIDAALENGRVFALVAFEEGWRAARARRKKEG